MQMEIREASTVYNSGPKGREHLRILRIRKEKVRSFFTENDKQDGLRTIWYENGNKRLTALFVNGKMEGNSKGWFSNGQMLFEYNFQKQLGARRFVRSGI